jgi:hypothetical protein
MKRGEFLKEMAGSLFSSVKSAYEPFMAEDLEKMEEAADRALGVTWVPLMNESKLDYNLEMKFLNGIPVVIFCKGTTIQAVSGVCPECSTIIILSSQNSSGKCLNCEKEINFKTDRGDLKLESLPIKVKGHQYLLGLHKLNKIR